MAPAMRGVRAALLCFGMFPACRPSQNRSNLEHVLKLRFGKSLNIALLACAATLSAAGPAEAAYVVIKADPTYGPAYPGLGWRASGALYVPDSCLAAVGSSTTTLAMASDSLCAGAQIENVKIHFYNTGDPATTIEILNVGIYAEDTGAPGNVTDVSQELLDLSFNGGLLTGLHTSLSLPVLSNDLLAGHGADWFSLEFSSPGSHLVSFANGTGTPNAFQSESQFEPVYTIGDWIADTAYVATPDEAVVPTRAVPEPGSLGLVLGAVLLAGLAGLASRRRRG